MEVPVLDVSTDHEEVEEARHHVDGCRGGEDDGPGLEQSGPLEDSKRVYMIRWLTRKESITGGIIKCIDDTSA